MPRPTSLPGGRKRSPFSSNRDTKVIMTANRLPEDVASRNLHSRKPPNSEYPSAQCMHDQQLLPCRAEGLLQNALPDAILKIFPFVLPRLHHRYVIFRDEDGVETAELAAWIKDMTVRHAPGNVFKTTPSTPYQQPFLRKSSQSPGLSSAFLP